VAGYAGIIGSGHPPGLHIQCEREIGGDWYCVGVFPVNDVTFYKSWYGGYLHRWSEVRPLRNQVELIGYVLILTLATQLC
jgi:hypothetical protein